MLLSVPYHSKCIIGCVGAECQTFSFPQCRLHEPKRLYLKPLTISLKKFQDLKQLCVTDVVPSRCHPQYLELMTDETVKDALAETDEEDEEQ